MKTLTKNIIGNRRLTINLENITILKNVTIHEVGKKDIMLKNSTIERIADHVEEIDGADVLDLSGKYLIPGAIDSHALFREPGREDVETLKTGSLAAANGGFTQVCIFPSTSPPIDSVEMVQFILDKTENYLVDINVVAAMSKKQDGKSIAPYAELAEEGAIAFSDGRESSANAKLMETALEYCKMLDKPIIVKANDSSLNEGGQMHEGFHSTVLGFTGMPSIAEEIIISRDLHIAEYVDGKIHFTNISTKRSVELIREAKKRGVKVSCDVAIHNLLNTDEAMYSFDTNLKLDPPLRSKEDLDELITGLKDGTIDMISSAHVPHSWEEKEAEYIYAPFGAVSLETMIPLLLDRFYHSKILTMDQIIGLICKNPAKIFKLDSPALEEGERATFTILDLNKEHIIDKNKFLSKSNNSPYNGIKIKGTVYGVINNGKKFITGN